MVKKTSKLKKLMEEMQRRGKVLVAFSGGVDSSLVAKIAYDALGQKALAITADSATLPRSELLDSKRIAKEIGIRHRIVSFSELDSKGFRENPPNRCYYCRKELSRALKIIASEEGIETIADGINASDFGEHRPGIIAADEEGFWHPLAELGITKKEARQLAKDLRLSVYDKPSMACLSSRIPYGDEITIEKLRKIEKAEDFLRSLRFKQVRVRYHDGIARIEVSKEEIPKLLDPKIAEKVSGRLKKIGYKYVTLDLQGYRSGSMDEVL